MSEIETDRIHIRQVVNSPGGRLILKHIIDESEEGFRQFIKLPVERKTSKASFTAQARYQVLQDLHEWILLESKMAE